MSVDVPAPALALAPLISVAPMMQYTDRHFRVVMRQLTKHALLTTEMVTSGAILHGDREAHIGFDPIEHPLALQVGGDDPIVLAECAKIAEGRGYDAVNLNVGCPSSRVRKGNFGASLMRTPNQVADIVAAMRDVVSIPVTVKHRIGVDDLDHYDDMLNFVDTVAATGCRHFIVHARKAWLNGLSPKDNRTIPPLRHADVYRLKRERPNLWIETNGGVRDLDVAATHLEYVDSVMIGRAAYENSYVFADVDRRFYGDERPIPTRHEMVEALIPYIERHLSAGGRMHHVMRHLLPLFSYQKGTRAWKQHLSTHGYGPDVGIEVLRAALKRVPRPDEQVVGA